MSNQATQIIITIVILLIALGVGLYLRRRLVRRLKKTILDNWLIQISGIIVIIPPIIAGFLIILLINGWNANQAESVWKSVSHVLGIPDFPTLIGNLLWSAVIILLAIGVGRTLGRLLTEGRTASRINVNVRTLFRRAAYVATIVVAIFWILTVWNISFAIPAASLSVLTVGLAFVIQDILKNFAAGIYILLEGPFHIGDKITTDKYTGRVEDVQLRATKLRINNGEQVIVPNAILFSEIVINKTFYKESRATITITMRQEDFDIDQTTECVLKTIKEVNGVLLKPEPELRLTGTAGSFGGTTGITSGYTGRIITLALRFWFPEETDSIVLDAMLALRTALPHADLNISEGV